MIFKIYVEQGQTVHRSKAIDQQEKKQIDDQANRLIYWTPITEWVSDRLKMHENNIVLLHVNVTRIHPS